MQPFRSIKRWAVDGKLQQQSNARGTMQAPDHVRSRYEVGGVLLSSAGRGWRGITAELRSHAVGEIPDMRRVREDFARSLKFVDEIMHIYLSLDSFAALTKEMSRNFGPAAIRYDAGFQDPLIERIALELVGELRHETSCGDLLAETLADSLAVRLLNNYSTWSGSPSPITRRSKALDPRRLSRVLDYVDQNLTREITVDQLASVASLSRFHFSRMFKATTGYPPSRFIGGRRLELAKSLLVEGVSIAQVAQTCRFSSDSNFARAFRRATGLTPTQYRDRRRQ